MIVPMPKEYSASQSIAGSASIGQLVNSIREAGGCLSIDSIIHCSLSATENSRHSRLSLSPAAALLLFDVHDGCSEKVSVQASGNHSGGGGNQPAFGSLGVVALGACNPLNLPAP